MTFPPCPNCSAVLLLLVLLAGESGGNQDTVPPLSVGGGDDDIWSLAWRSRLGDELGAFMAKLVERDMYVEPESNVLLNGTRAAWLEIVLPHAQLPQTARVLDIGCGPCVLAEVAL